MANATRNDESFDDGACTSAGGTNPFSVPLADSVCEGSGPAVFGEQPDM
jgi:hypothetical protein